MRRMVPARAGVLNMQICLANEVVSLHDPAAVGTQSGCVASCEVMPESQGNSGDYQSVILLA